MFIITQNGDAVVSDAVRAFSLEKFYDFKNQNYDAASTSLVADCGYSVFTLGTYSTIDEAATELQNVLRQIISKRDIYVVSGAEEG